MQGAVVGMPQVGDVGAGAASGHPLAPGQVSKWKSSQLDASALVRHVPVDWHHPQPDSAKQESHDRLPAAQTGAGAQAADAHPQSAHAPTLGPSREPGWHVALDRHQPHPGSSTQSPQLDAPHAAASHAAAKNAHNSHVPARGPDELPAVHVAVDEHHPQPVVMVHAPQSRRLEHGSAPLPAQTPDSHRRSESQPDSPQHGWSKPPHSGGVVQIPSWQLNPDAHDSPGQQSVRLAPQAAGVRHVARSQTNPD